MTAYSTFCLIAPVPWALGRLETRLEIIVETIYSLAWLLEVERIVEVNLINYLVWVKINSKKILKEA